MAAPIIVHRIIIFAILILAMDLAYEILVKNDEIIFRFYFVHDMLTNSFWHGLNIGIMFEVD